MTQITIIHFQPIEKYPPVMNFINSIISEKNIYCNVYTTNNIENNWYYSKKSQIFRIGSQSLFPIKRYWGYLQFNLVVFLKLFFSNPKIVIAYETYSIVPVFFYKILFSKSKIFIHYHEYTSPFEIKKSSIYFKVVHFFEKKLFAICDFISHTNTDRIDLFLEDNAIVEKSKTFVAPNFPPFSWYVFAKKNKKVNGSGVVKLVHVGAIGLDSMHIKEIINFVMSQNGKYCIDFYSNNISNEAQILFENLDNEYVRLLNAVNYFELPKILINYDIGVTLYNGHIPNYVYNVPNKVFEYLACGLNVWYSSDLVSTQKFVELNEIKGCHKIDFLNNKIPHLATLSTFNENSFFESTIDTIRDKVIGLLNFE